MIEGLGIDIVKNKRIKEKKANHTFVERILSKEEYAIYQQLTLEKRQTEFLAGRFAGKEALFKAMKAGDKTLSYKDISILPDASNAPIIQCEQLKNKNTMISISHEEDDTVAVVIITSNEF